MRRKVHRLTYVSWQAMIQRCTNRKLRAWSRYGGRGIVVCERWRTSYEHFLADMGERPPGRTLDRFPDNDGNYEPGNCRWATPDEQTHSSRRVTKRARRDRPGRPALGDAKRSRNVQIRVTPAVDALITRAAERAGLSRSDWGAAALEQALATATDPPTT